MQKFNQNTMESYFIKGILANTPIPTIKTVVNGDYIIANTVYIYNQSVIFCTSGGILGEKGTMFEYVGAYDFGLYYPQFTHKYISNTDYYDTKTHEWLGNYLRAYRDITGVDLMSLYNCYSDCTIDTVIIGDDEVGATKNCPYKIVKIPIRFDKIYTVCIECDTPLKIAAAFMRNKHLLSVSSTSINNMLWEKSGSITPYSSMQFKAPKKFLIENKTTNKEILKEYENNLYMLIQLPKTHKSSIVVLEGDYTNTNSYKIIDFNSVKTMKSRELDRICQSNTSLMMLNGDYNIPFSKELVPYLLLHPITKAERIDDNISRIQSKTGLWYPKPSRGVWTNVLRYKIKDMSRRYSQSPLFDSIGYVDKKNEKILYSSVRKRNTL